MNNKIQSLFLLVLFSCSHVKMIEKNKDVSNKTYAGVDFESSGINEEGNDKPIIVKNAAISPMGPNPLHEDLIENEENNKIEPVVSVVLGPGLLRVVAYLGVLKQLEKNKIKVNIVSGSGMGALLSLFYAKEGSVAAAEWELFKLLQSFNPGWEVYGTKWREHLDRKIQELFKKKSIQELKIMTIFPILNSDTDKVEFHTTGPIYELLQTSLFLSNVKKTKNRASQIREIFNDAEFKRRGADFVICLNTIPEKIELVDKSGFKIGLYTMLADRVMKEKTKIGHFYDLTDKYKELDSYDNLQNLLKYSEEIGEEIANQLKNEISDWKIARREAGKNGKQ